MVYRIHHKERYWAATILSFAAADSSEPGQIPIYPLLAKGGGKWYSTKHYKSIKIASISANATMLRVKPRKRISQNARRKYTNANVPVISTTVPERKEAVYLDD